MAEIGRRIGVERLDDYRRVSEVAEDLEINPQTLKRWLKDSVVPGVKWGRDRRQWIYIHRDSVKLLRKHRDRIDLH